MPTIDERLRRVEDDFRRFKIETIKMQEVHTVELAVVKGLTQDCLHRLDNVKQEMHQRFDTINFHFKTIDTRFASFLIT